MNRLLKLLDKLRRTDATAIAGAYIAMILIFVTLIMVSIWYYSLPHEYQVQCKLTANVPSQISLVSRINGLRTSAPAPDVTGKAKISSNDKCENYDITFDSTPCQCLSE